MKKSLGILCLFGLLFMINSVEGGTNCGGTVICNCGDTIIEDTNLTYDLISCPSINPYGLSIL
jgi:hypothetical protein